MFDDEALTNQPLDIFTTNNFEDTISGNILTTISDHLAQFISYPIE